MSEIRGQGVGDIREVYYAILEQTGKLSVLKRDAGGGTSHPVIIDGEINEAALSMLGLGKEWVDGVLRKSRLKLYDVFVMTVDEECNTYIIRKEKK